MSQRIELDADRPAIGLPGAVLHEICRHALDVAPEECCGLVLGHRDERYLRAVRITNIMTRMHVEDPETFPRDARHAYYMSEVEYQKAIVEAEQRAEFVSAVYHSHVGRDCYLSEDDLSFARHPLFPFPEADQLVISVLAGRVERVGLFEPCPDEDPSFIGKPVEPRVELGDPTEDTSEADTA